MAAGRCSMAATSTSASVKAYFALKSSATTPDAPHMKRAREAMLAHGGAETANVFTRYRAGAVRPDPLARRAGDAGRDSCCMPQWFPVHIWKFSYWSRTVIVPLLVLMALKPQAAIRAASACQELFTHPAREGAWNGTATRPGGAGASSSWAFDKLLQPLEPHVFPRLPSGSAQSRRRSTSSLRG